ncbi:PREDICTED: RANBP2-like and GRIP domain-containing protein 1 [Priapulus caudatus]|nr:PREDICTED: RANBP2-like and GRIP domain-containing protein 1 [Priapulus caudatus]
MAEQYSAGHDKKPTQKITQLLRTEQGRDRIFHSVFVHRDHRKKKATSYLGTSQELIDFDVEWPVKQDLAEYDRETSKEKQDSLHHLTWLALHRYTQRSDAQPDLFHSDGFTMFDELLYSTTNLKVVRPESLCKLDTIAFLYATVYTTLGRLEEQKRTIGEDLDRPFLLPAIVSESLCSPQQADWWKAAYKLVNNAAGEDLASLRVTLQRGLEVVRATGIHGLSAQLVVQLARTFQHQASAKINPSTPESQRTQLAARAVHYWKAALNILEKLNQ